MGKENRTNTTHSISKGEFTNKHYLQHLQRWNKPGPSTKQNLPSFESILKDMKIITVKSAI